MVWADVSDRVFCRCWCQLHENVYIRLCIQNAVHGLVSADIRFVH